jgi:hypothetical protein
MLKFKFYLDLASLCIYGALVYLMFLGAYLGELKGYLVALFLFNTWWIWNYNTLLHELLEKWGIRKK